MAERHLGGIAGAGEDELAAMTGGGAFHGAQAYHRAASKQDARSPLIAASFIDPQAAPCLSALAPPPALLRLDVAAGHRFQKPRHYEPRKSLQPLSHQDLQHHISRGTMDRHRSEPQQFARVARADLRALDRKRVG